mmetsp:Transcript_117619/g.332740  ORF Transcript_117619/g.332740 Transcript_117619/m.332740 type:complete len:209 (-) Transcript_117619:1161-1787(-)
MYHVRMVAEGNQRFFQLFSVQLTTDAVPVERLPDLRQFILAELPHESEKLGEVQLSAVVRIDLQNELADVIQRRRITKEPEYFAQLQYADLPRQIDVEALEGHSHCLNLVLQETVPLVEDHNEVEIFVERQFAAWVPWLVQHFCEYLVQDLLQGRAFRSQEDFTQVGLRYTSVLVEVVRVERRTHGSVADVGKVFPVLLLLRLQKLSA